MGRATPRTLGYIIALEALFVRGSRDSKWEIGMGPLEETLGLTAVALGGGASQQDFVWWSPQGLAVGCRLQAFNLEMWSGVVQCFLSSHFLLTGSSSRG